MEKVKLALFDIDYTITRKETLMEFYKYIVFKDIKNIHKLYNEYKFFTKYSVLSS